MSKKKEFFLPNEESFLISKRNMHSTIIKRCKGHFFSRLCLSEHLYDQIEKQKYSYDTNRKEKSQLNNQLNDFIRHHILRKNIRLLFFFSL